MPILKAQGPSGTIILKIPAFLNENSDHRNGVVGDGVYFYKKSMQRERIGTDVLKVSSSTAIIRSSQAVLNEEGYQPNFRTMRSRYERTSPVAFLQVAHHSFEGSVVLMEPLEKCLPFPLDREGGKGDPTIHFPENKAIGG